LFDIEALMNPILLALAFLPTLALGTAEATGLVNTEAGTFRCRGNIVRLDRQGVPFSGDPGGQMKRCDLIVEVKDTI
jgi:hypothetical protein